jgi:hypothetical protein
VGSGNVLGQGHHDQRYQEDDGAKKLCHGIAAQLTA